MRYGISRQRRAARQGDDNPEVMILTVLALVVYRAGAVGLG